MERGHEEAKTQKSPRRGSWQVGWASAQRGQAAGQPRKWPQGRPGQKPQEESRSPAQRAATAARSPEELIETVIASIRARFGDWAIGLGDHGIRFAGACSLGAPCGDLLVVRSGKTENRRRRAYQGTGVAMAMP
jgi:hypothetical protein